MRQTNEQQKAFEPELTALLAAVRTQVDAWTEADLLNRRNAPRFNLFDFLKSDETGLSNVFAWLLDPSGSHGQGTDFLKLFLETFGVAVAAGLDGARVTTEARTHLIEKNMRRLDVRARIGTFVLAIENKPKAAFREDQVRHYLDEIAEEADEHCLVVVKSRPGVLPPSQLNDTERAAALAAGRLVDGDYTGVVAWLDACAAATPAPSVRLLLEHLSQKSAEFLGERDDMRTDRDVTDALLANANLRRSAFDLLSAKTAMLGRLADNLRDDVAREVAGTLQTVVGRRVEAAGKYDPEGKWGGSNLSFDFDPTAPFVLMVGFHDYDLQGLYLGHETRESVPAPAEAIALRPLFTRLFGKDVATHKAWVFWVDVTDRTPGDPASVPAGWEALADGSAAKLAGEWTLKTIKALTGFGKYPWLPHGISDGLSS